MDGNNRVTSIIRKWNLLFTFCLLSIFNAPAQSVDTSVASHPSTQKTQNTSISHKITAAPNQTFGYDIFLDSRLLIHQPSVPGLPGTQGFIRKTDAEKIATLVIKKIENGTMPPTITLKELDSLHIKY
jgi:hypothetical protein